MHLSLQFFSKETDNEGLSKHSQDQRHERQYTSQYIEIEVDGVIYPVCLYQPTENTTSATEIIKNLINRNTKFSKALAKEIDWS